MTAKIIPIRGRILARIRIYEDDLGEFTVEYPELNTRASYSYASFATAAEARQRAQVLSSSHTWRVVDETLPNLGGAA